MGDPGQACQWEGQVGSMLLDILFPYLSLSWWGWSILSWLLCHPLSNHLNDLYLVGHHLIIFHLVHGQFHLGSRVAWWLLIFACRHEGMHLCSPSFCSLVMELQEEEGISVQWYILNLVPQGNPGHGTKIYERGGRYFITVPANSQLSPTLQPGTMRCHSTRDCKRCPSTSLC